MDQLSESRRLVVTDLDSLYGLDAATVNLSSGDARLFLDFTYDVERWGFEKALRRWNERLSGLKGHVCAKPYGAIVSMGVIHDRGEELGYDSTSLLTKPLLAIARLARALPADECDTIGVYCARYKHHLHQKCSHVATNSRADLNRILIDLSSLEKALSDEAFVERVVGLGYSRVGALTHTISTLYSKE